MRKLWDLFLVQLGLRVRLVKSPAVIRNIGFGIFAVVKDGKYAVLCGNRRMLAMKEIQTDPAYNVRSKPADYDVTDMVLAIMEGPE